MSQGSNGLPKPKKTYSNPSTGPLIFLVGATVAVVWASGVLKGPQRTRRATF